MMEETFASCPGLSMSATLIRTSRPSFTRPRSMIRATRFTSMFPPETIATTVFPSRWTFRCMSAATETAPAPSATVFSFSSR